MRTSIRHLTQSVATLLTTSTVDRPRRTRQRLIFVILGSLLAAAWCCDGWPAPMRS